MAWFLTVAVPRVAGAVQPELGWSTYVGGNKLDQIHAITLDADGNIYATGQTYSAGGISAGGIYDSTLNGGADAFVVKFNANGVRQWGFYLGSLTDDAGFAIAIQGDRLVIGGVAGGVGVGTPGTFQPEPLSAAEGFIVEFTLAGNLVWGTYVGSPNGNNAVYSLAFGDAGALYACGRVSTGGGVAIGAMHQPVFGGHTHDGFLMRLDTAGKRVWGTYYGGAGAGGLEDCSAVAYRPGGSVFIAGQTTSGGNISTMGGIKGPRDGYLARFYDNGIRDWGRYIGGGGDEMNTKMIVDPAGGLVLLIESRSPGLATDGTTCTVGGGTDLVIARISDAGATTFATYYGGKYDDLRGALALGLDGSIYVSGATSSPTGIAGVDAFQPKLNSNIDGFFGKLSPDVAREGEPTSGPSTATIICARRWSAATVA